jgi:hypothetical protein
MKRLLYSLFIFSFSLLCTPSVFGQKCSDYPCVIANVKKAMGAKNYKLAFEQLESADAYPNKNGGEITGLRKRLFEAVDNEKKKADTEAETARKERDRAEKEKQKADEAFKKAEIEAEKALKERDKAIVAETKAKQATTAQSEAERKLRRNEEEKATKVATDSFLEYEKRMNVYITEQNTDSAAFFANAALSIWDSFRLNEVGNSVKIISAFVSNKAEIDKDIAKSDSLVKVGYFKNYLSAFKTYIGVNKSFPKYTQKNMENLKQLVKANVYIKDSIGLKEDKLEVIASEYLLAEINYSQDSMFVSDRIRKFKKVKTDIFHQYEILNSTPMYYSKIIKSSKTYWISSLNSFFEVTSGLELNKKFSPEFGLKVGIVPGFESYNYNHLSYDFEYKKYASFSYQIEDSLFNRNLITVIPSRLSLNYRYEIDLDDKLSFGIGMGLGITKEKYFLSDGNTISPFLQIYYLTLPFHAQIKLNVATSWVGLRASSSLSYIPEKTQHKLSNLGIYRSYSPLSIEFFMAHKFGRWSSY